MKRDTLRMLHSALDAQRLAQQAELRPLVMRENSLKRALDRLNDQINTTEIPFSMKSSGADLSWKLWSDIAKARLEAAQAQLQAEKTEIEAKTRLALGKTEAAATMLADQNKEQRQKKMRSQEQALIALAVIKPR